MYHSLVLLNLALAHYRDLSAGHIVEAGKLIFERLRMDPLGLADINSWLFFGIGLLISVITMIDVLLIYDRYPGYERVDRRLRQARARYVALKEHLIGQLTMIKDDAVDALEQASRNLSARKAEHDEILDRKAKLAKLYQAHVAHLERLANSLLQLYRDENRKARSTKAPKYFSDHAHRIVYSLDTASVAVGERLKKLDDEVSEAQRSLTDQQRQIQDKLCRGR